MTVPMLAYQAGTFVVIGLILGVVLLIYSVYYFFFRLGKK